MEASMGSVFMIILSVFVVLLLFYFVVGSIVRYNKGMRGFPEMLPNYRCWCALVGWILVIITCGRYRRSITFPVGGRSAYNFAFANGGYYGNTNSINDNSNNSIRLCVLPSRSWRASNVTFEALQSDAEEDFSEEVGAALQPAGAVVFNSFRKEKE